MIQYITLPWKIILLMYYLCSMFDVVVDMNSASRKAEKTYVNYSPEISKISGLFSAMGVWKKQRD